jgi:uncharacterized protein (DUF433 family)
MMSSEKHEEIHCDYEDLEHAQFFDCLAFAASTTLTMFTDKL